VPYTYEWSNGATTSNISGLIAGSYTVTVEDGNGCTAVGSTVIVEPAQLVVTSSGTQYICSGAPVTLVSNVSGGTPKYVYSWSNGGGTNADANVAPAFTTIYTVTVEDGNGCIGTSASEVIAGTPLVVSVAGKASVCPGGTVTLTASGSGGDGKYSYLWLPGNEVSRSITINPTQNTTVTVELTDACGSAMASEAVGVSVNPLPKVSFSSDVVSGCVPLCIQFRDLTTIGSGGVGQWNWSFGDGDSSRIKSPIYCYKDTGIFSVGLTVVSDSGCSSTLKVSNDIEVYAGPKAGFRYSPNPVDVESPEVYFTDESRGEYPVREWYWTFGQGDSVSEAENPEHYYPDTGTFCVRLIVEDIHGCVDSVRECLVIDPQYSFFIPDAFTPNGDGINDEFMPKGRYISSYEMYVFDRWGMQLFHSTDMSKGWDGTRGGGTVCQEDTYVYLIKVTDSQGNVHNYTGKISLIK
jgi:gliding motility-associated-like protein